jgi:hypothetical protein
MCPLYSNDVFFYLVMKVYDYYPLSCLAYNVLQKKEAAEECLDHCKFHINAY